ncbi:dephospho-CoA kinase [Gemella sanguinis]|jgi:dephospho-coA kinase|uniref:Dephospho-CoA kinase n=1 Tax=Gemella sanguinis TaxID=84135 RepID=A0A2N6SE58_9BACL|nr:dephospho-CoA kinase [Gemella sanguinis]PMC52234.1 dephospho-CoA kinase [Gemella sanguinis]
MIIGITGSIACGKSTVSNYLKSKGYIVIDADKIGHEALDDDYVKEKLILAFGNEILDDNKINRQKLGELVFGNSSNLNVLNSIIHPEIRKKILQKIDKNNDKEFIFIDVALLFEAKFDDLVDKIIVVYVDKNTQLTRLMKRNSISEKEALSRIVSQMSPIEKAKLGDYTVNNNLDVINTYEQVDKVLSELKKGYCK